MPAWTQRFIQLLINWRWLLLGLALLGAILAYGPANRLGFDRSIENMFAPDDPFLVPYRKLKRVFGGNEIVMAVYVDRDLFSADKSGLRRLKQVRQRCEQVPGVRAVLTLDRLIGDEILEPDSELAQRTRALFENYTHGADAETAAAICMLEPQEEASAPREQTIAELRAIIEDLPDDLPPGVLAGEPVMVVDGFRYVEQDGDRLSLWSTALLSLTIVICFRSLRWLIVPAAVVQLTLLFTKATLVAVGFRLSMVSSMLTAIVTVVAVATVVHIIVRFREGRASGLQPREALVRAGTILAMPILWACLTDAVGFAALIFSRVGPVQDFGLMMALGSLLVPLSVVLVIPALALAGRFGASPPQGWGEARLDGQLANLNRWAGARPATVGVAAVLVAGLAIGGVLQLEVESDFTKNFRRGSRIVQSYEFVEENLGGAGVWDIILPAPDSLDWDYLQRVRRLEQRLREEAVVVDEQARTAAELTKVLSLADAIVAMAPTDLEQVRLSMIRNAMIRTGFSVMEGRMPALADALYSQDPLEDNAAFLRVMLRARERQPADQKQALIEQVERISREEFPGTDQRPAAQVTGFYVLLATLINSLIRDQWLTFGVATLGIALMLLIAFRSLRYAAAALVPNALPILLVLGVMGWLGIRVNMGAAMIAAVSMGLSIDSSIHYVTFFRRARRAGKAVEESLAEVQQSVGRAVVLSTLALIVGFSVLCTSQFVPTVYFGMLVSLAMLGGLLGNLVLLPLLLRGVERLSR